MKSVNEKSYETELNAIKALLPELDEIIHKIRVDNQLATSESLPHRQVASLYDMYPPQTSPYLPAGQWNVAGIKVLDNEVEHWLNEKLVLQYNLKSDDFLERKIESKWYDDSDWAMAGIGHISLQDHGDKVEFKRVAIRRIK